MYLCTVKFNQSTNHSINCHSTQCQWPCTLEWGCSVGPWMLIHQQYSALIMSYRPPSQPWLVNVGSHFKTVSIQWIYYSLVHTLWLEEWLHVISLDWLWRIWWHLALSLANCVTTHQGCNKEFFCTEAEQSKACIYTVSFRHLRQALTLNHTRRLEIPLRLQPLLP